jgi:hypothetical protein
MKSDSYIKCKKEFKNEQRRLEIKDYFVRLLKTETSLPDEFSFDVLTKYLMFDEALLFLFYRKDYK